MTRYRIYHLYRFTPREQSICERLMTGESNAEIAYELDLALSTVKNAMTLIHEKLGTDNRTQTALVLAGVIPVPKKPMSDDRVERWSA